MKIRHAIFSWMNRKLIRQTAHAWDNPAQAQQQILERLLQTHRNAGYLTDHGDPTPSNFRQRLPVVLYNDLKPWIDPLVAQGPGAAHTVVDEPVSLFLKTSGTTGPAKLLPVTRSYEESTDRGRRIWVRAMLDENDDNGDGAHASVISPMHEGLTPGGIPYGSNTGRIFKRQMSLVQVLAPAPYALYSLKAFDLRYYLILRYYAATFDVGTLTTANPSTILLLCRRLAQWLPEIADDIEAGRICGPERMRRLKAASFGELTDHAEALKALQAKTRRDPKRAAQLRRAATLGDEGLLPRVWPKLTTVNCWLGGHAPFYTGRIRPFLLTASGDPLPTRDPGFSASEGLFAMPLRSETPEGVLHVLGPFMEFVPEGESADRTLLAHELEVGRRYRIIVTTGGGLWRYDMNDVIEVTGHHHATPMVRFMYKAGGTLSVTGEKVTEDHAIAVATRLAAAHGAVEQTCATLDLTDPPRYAVAVELAPGAEGSLTAHQLAQRWDALMCEENIEYREKRGSGRLAPAVVHVVSAGTFNRWRQRRVERGAPDGQVKLSPLMRSMDDLRRELLEPEGPAG